MQIYVIISPSQAEERKRALAEAVKANFEENDRIEVADGAWFVRSSLETAVQVRNALGIKVDGHGGVVVTSEYHTGVVSSDFVERLRAWKEIE